MILSKILEICEEAGIEIVSREPNGGGWVPCKCPFAQEFHEKGIDSNPSFFIKVSPNGVSACHCFTCKEHGRLSKILRLMDHYEETNERMRLIIRADMEEIPSSFGNFEEEREVQPERQPVVEDVFFNMYPLAFEDAHCRAYLEQRGIGKGTAEVLGLRFDSNEMRVLFPVRGRAGELYGFSGRAVARTNYSRHRDYGFDKDQCLLGEHLFQPGKPIVLVEGLFAFAHLVEIGARRFANPMAPMMSNVSHRQADLLEEMDEPVYLLFDPDEAGDVGTYGKDGKSGAVGLLRSRLRLRVGLYPEGLDDIDNISLQQFQRIIEVDYETP